MSEFQLGKWRMRGAYGTNEGDVWLGEGSVTQRMLDEDGQGLILVHEMLVKDGELQEVLYTTANAEMIDRAREGHKLWVAARAREN